MKKNVIIKISANSLYNYIQIYQEKNIVLEKRIKDTITLKGIIGKAYKIKITTCYMIYYASIYISRNCEYYHLNFQNNLHPILITITDKNYQGLKIKKGEITFG